MALKGRNPTGRNLGGESSSPTLSRERPVELLPEQGAGPRKGAIQRLRRNPGSREQRGELHPDCGPDRGQCCRPPPPGKGPGQAGGRAVGGRPAAAHIALPGGGAPSRLGSCPGASGSERSRRPFSGVSAGAAAAS